MFTHTNTHTHTHSQTYRMHLKSTNGPIDVLVCPESDNQRSESPCPSLPNEHSNTSTPSRTHNHKSSNQHQQMNLLQESTVPHITQSGLQQPQVTVTNVDSVPIDDLDISLSSTADIRADELEGLMDSYNCDHLGHLDGIAASDISALSFEVLESQLQSEDFFSAMDTPTEGIQDLFDLV